MATEGKKKGKKKGGKGKGKKGKGKKKDSNEGKTEKEILYEMEIESQSKTLQVYKSHTESLKTKNITLFKEMQEQERDTVEVLGFLRKEGDSKDEQIDYLSSQLKESRSVFKKEKESLISDFNQQINTLEEQLSEKDNELKFMQAELKVVKEFRKKRTQMQKELDGIKGTMHEMNKRHKETISKMEHKFFEEKVRLQQEANQKVTELASKAHEEAVGNLRETTKNIFRENVRITEALRYHVEEGKELRKATEVLGEQAGKLMEEKEMNDRIVREKIVQVQLQTDMLKQLSDKVLSLESSLSKVVKEFDKERDFLVSNSAEKIRALELEIDNMKRAYSLKCKEMNHIKRLARNILDQRTETEQFLLESLDLVKREISNERKDVERAQVVAYNTHLKERLYEQKTADAFPAIKSFKKSKIDTIKGVVDSSQEKYFEKDAEIGIEDLSWQEREKVLGVFVCED